jgi:hypothetical protein
MGSPCSSCCGTGSGAAQPRARRLVEIVRFNAQDAREFSDPLVRDAIASVFIAADLPRRYVGGLGKLAHRHPAMLTVFLQALSDPWGSSSERKKERFPSLGGARSLSACREATFIKSDF